MAEAYLTPQKSNKKRKISENSSKGKKKMDLLASALSITGSLPSTNASLTTSTLPSIQETVGMNSLGVESNLSTNISQQPSQATSSDQDSNPVLKHSYHIGGKRYLIFYGNGAIEEVILKKWDGEKVLNKGVRLNLSRFIMILHNVEAINQTLQKIIEGESVKTKIHIGGGYYLSCNTPYKTVGIRLWKLNNSGELYPTNEGQTLKQKEWLEFIKIANEYYASKIEIFTHVPCLLQQDKPGHNKILCPECSVEDPSPQGRVNYDIPI